MSGDTEPCCMQCKLAEGYKVMSAENIKLAEEFLPIVFEVLPVWEE